MDDENRIRFCRSCCVGNVLEKTSGTCIVEEVAEDVFRGDPVKSHVVNNENFIALPIATEASRGDLTGRAGHVFKLLLVVSNDANVLAFPLKSSVVQEKVVQRRHVGV